MKAWTTVSTSLCIIVYTWWYTSTLANSSLVIQTWIVPPLVPSVLGVESGTAEGYYYETARLCDRATDGMGQITRPVYDQFTELFLFARHSLGPQHMYPRVPRFFVHCTLLSYINQFKCD